jgi:hypothetical protein
MRRGLVVVLCSSLVLGGCSFVFVKGPPANHEQLPAVTCTESWIVPGLDTAFTAIQVISLAYAASASEWNENFLSRTGSIVLYAGLAALGGAGMYYGFTRTKRCRAAKAQSRMRGGDQGSWPAPRQPSPPTAPL